MGRVAEWGNNLGCQFFRVDGEFGTELEEDYVLTRTRQHSHVCFLRACLRLHFFTLWITDPVADIPVSTQL